MEEYYFLFLLAFFYVLIASIQDIKSREVPNWINFSFIAFALAYRLFYSSYIGDYMFFAFGVFGALIFYLLANLFYYSNVFGGGDAKLLIGFGAIIPFSGFFDFFINGIAFILLIFTVGTIYSSIFSLFLAIGKRKEFAKSFRYNFKSKKWIFLIGIGAIVLLFVEGAIFGVNRSYVIFSGLFFILIPLFYIYLKAVEDSCLIKLVDPEKLTEGDWILNDIRVKNRVVKKNVHGLSFEDIKLLKMAGKKVLVKYGVPFVPSFFIALIIMELFFLISQVDLQSLLFSLF